MAAAIDLRADLVSLVKQRASLEGLLIVLIAAGEDFARGNGVRATTRRRPLIPAPKLQDAAHRIGKLIGTVENRIARVDAVTLQDAIVKLEVYADCQDYALNRPRRGPRSFEERLFHSIVDDLHRIDRR